MDRPDDDLAALDQVRVGIVLHPDAGALVGPLQEGYPPRDARGAYTSRFSYGAPYCEIEGRAACCAATANGKIDLVSHAVDELTGNAPMAFTGL